MYIIIIPSSKYFPWNIAGPSTPPRSLTLADVGSTHFSASWEPPLPQDRNGVIRQYLVNLWQIGSRNGPHTVFTNSIPNITISDLLPYHAYVVTVTAITVDHGPQSNSISFQTLEDGEILETSCYYSGQFTLRHIIQCGRSRKLKLKMLIST